MITLTATALLAIHAIGSTAKSAVRRSHSDQRGEGVISAAIAVLIMAFLGAAMWVAFNSMFTDTTERTRESVSEIAR